PGGPGTASRPTDFPGSGGTSLGVEKRKLGLILVECGPGALGAQVTKLLVELIQILKVPVNRGETDVGDVVLRPQLLHDELADEPALDLLGRDLRDPVFDRVHHLLDLGTGDGTLRAGQPDGAQDLLTVVRLGGTVPFQDEKGALLHVLVRGEATITVETFAPAADRPSLAAGARVDDAVLGALAVRTTHLPPDRLKPPAGLAVLLR